MNQIEDHFHIDSLYKWAYAGRWPRVSYRLSLKDTTPAPVFCSDELGEFFK